MAEMTLMSANMLPTSSGDTQREIKVLVQTVVTGVNKAKTKPKMNHNWPLMKAGRDHPMAPVMQATIKVVASCSFKIREAKGKSIHNAIK